jgi:resolvase-like protein
LIDCGIALLTVFRRSLPTTSAVNSRRSRHDPVGRWSGYEDASISGAKGRDKRPGFDRLLKDATAGKINMIAAWSVDRLGRSLQDLVGFLNELQALGCNLYLINRRSTPLLPPGVPCSRCAASSPSSNGA